MKDLFKNVLKHTAIMFTVGAALALVAPLVAMATIMPGETYAGAAALLENTANPLWLGSFFGAFGAIQTVVSPLIEKLLPASPAPLPERATETPEQKVAVAINLELTPAQSKSFVEAIAAERAEPLGHTGQLHA